MNLHTNMTMFIGWNIFFEKEKKWKSIQNLFATLVDRLYNAGQIHTCPIAICQFTDNFTRYTVMSSEPSGYIVAQR